jgi:SAM-dependent methyltransferase
MNCRFCNNELSIPLIDLFNSPASNSFLTKEQLNEPETYFPLKVFICTDCFLVQIDEYKKSDSIFNNEYVYFSSYSKSWLDHAKRYTEIMRKKFLLHAGSQVIEVASNDGYLLQYFHQDGIPVMGIEPSGNTADVAIEKGIPTVVDFFGTKLAEKLRSEGKLADLLLGNNVLAHVPDIADFVKGLKTILRADGVITMEFPHLIELIKNNQFDTIYHEHFSYLSFFTVSRIFESFGLEMFDVEKLPTHGGSLRIYAKHKEDLTKEISGSVKELIEEELEWGVNNIDVYRGFQESALNAKLNLIRFLTDCRQKNMKVVAYGAAAKGNTLLNYCGVKNDLIEAVVDLNPHKQGKYLPGSHIPVKQVEWLKESKPDYILILPWNLQTEIMTQLKYTKEWDAKFVVPIPSLNVING